MHDRWTLFGWSIYILLLRLASFGAAPRPLPRLRGRSGLGFPSGGGCGCGGGDGGRTLGHVGRTCRSGTTVDSGVWTFVGVDFADGLIASNELLVHKAICDTSLSTHGERRPLNRRQLTLVCVLPASRGDSEGEPDRVQHGVGRHRALRSRIRRR